MNDKLYPLIYLVQINKIIVYSLSMNIRIMTGLSIIMTAISHNVTMISLIWANKIIVDSLSMDVIMITG